MSIKLPDNYNADEDMGLKSTWYNRAWVTSGCIAVTISLIKCIIGSIQTHIWLEPIIAGFAGYLANDLVIGTYHWAIDNYGSTSTPLFGDQITAFQGHHKWPWSITKRQFANKNSSQAQLVTLAIIPLLIFCHNPTLNGFIATFFCFMLFSQQIHSWAHASKSHLPHLVVSLQEIGVLVSRKDHGAHHREPYNNNYCIVGGMLNKLLDEMNFWVILEMFFFSILGVRPRSWDGPNANWTEETEKTLA